MKKKDSDNHIILGMQERAEDIKFKLIEKYGMSDFDVKSIFADEVPLQKILEDIEFLPVFSQKKILLIRNCESINTEACRILKEYFDNPPDHICIILSGKSVKEPLEEFVEEEAEEEFDRDSLFPAIFRSSPWGKNENLIKLFREHIRNNPVDFTSAVTAACMYLRNIVRKQKKADKRILNKYAELHKLDFNLKTGRLRPGAELEIFLIYLLFG